MKQLNLSPVKAQILELYLCSNEKSLKIIAEICNVSQKWVSDVIDQYYNGFFDFQIPNYKIFHSKMNIQD